MSSCRSFLDNCNRCRCFVSSEGICGNADVVPLVCQTHWFHSFHVGNSSDLPINRLIPRTVNKFALPVLRQCDVVSTNAMPAELPADLQKSLGFEGALKLRGMAKSDVVAYGWTCQSGRVVRLYVWNVGTSRTENITSSRHLNTQRQQWLHLFQPIKDTVTGAQRVLAWRDNAKTMDAQAESSLSEAFFQSFHHSVSSSMLAAYQRITKRSPLQPTTDKAQTFSVRDEARANRAHAFYGWPSVSSSRHCHGSPDIVIVNNKKTRKLTWGGRSLKWFGHPFMGCMLEHQTLGGVGQGVELYTTKKRHGCGGGTTLSFVFFSPLWDDVAGCLNTDHARYWAAKHPNW